MVKKTIHYAVAERENIDGEVTTQIILSPKQKNRRKNNQSDYFEKK